MITKDKEWKLLGSEYIFRKPWLTVRKDSYELPNGNIIPDYYILEYPEWVNVIAITKDQKFVMVRQFRPGAAVTRYELSAGVAEKSDESYLISAQRELLEETGYGGGTWTKYMEISPNPGTHTNTVYCYLATDVEFIASPHLDETEYLTVHLLAVDEIKDLLINNQILQAVQAAPLWKYMAENRLM